MSAKNENCSSYFAVQDFFASIWLRKIASMGNDTLGSLPATLCMTSFVSCTTFELGFGAQPATLITVVAQFFALLRLWLMQSDAI